MRPRDSFAREARANILKKIFTHQTAEYWEIQIQNQTNIEIQKGEAGVHISSVRLLFFSHSEPAQNPVLQCFLSQKGGRPMGGKTNSKMFWWILLSDFIAYKIKSHTK
jgi:hypothetical protein